MRSAPRGALIAALVVAVALLLGSVGATFAWARSAEPPFAVLRYDDGRQHGDDDGWSPDARRMHPGWCDVPGSPGPAPTTPPEPTRPQQLPTAPSMMPGRPVPIPTTPTR